MTTPENKIIKTDAEWRKQLAEHVYYVTREKGTERPFTGELLNEWSAGIYRCVCCRQPLFVSETKFDAGCGWPSFFEAINDTAITYTKDMSHGMIRTEITCSRCDAHLGHVFPDGPKPTGKRYCLNSVSLIFEALEDPSI